MSASFTNGIDGADEHPTKKRKAPGRTRAACEACRANKQRCDAQTSYPCRRCQLYGLECKLDAGTANGPNITRTAPVPVPGMPAIGASTGVDGRLQDIVERLSRIEFAVSQNAWAGNAIVPAVSPSNISPTAVPPFSPAHQSSNSSGPKQPSIDAVSQLTEDGALQQVRSIAANYNALMEEREDPTQAPDAIKRNILTEDVAKELFTFYFQHLEGATLPVVPAEQDSDMRAVRARSPLLFNTILLASAYYAFLGTDHGRAAYEALANLEAELLGPTMLFARMNSYHLSISTIRALMLNCCRKPLIHANIAGAAVPLAQQFLSKMDLTAATLPLHLAIRMAYLLNLRRKSMDILDPEKTPRPTAEEMWMVRTWFTLCSIDAQGSLQAGRIPTTNVVDNDSQLETFYIIRQRFSDIEQAAYLSLTRLGREARWNLFEVHRQKAGCVHHENDIVQLRIYQSEWSAWRERWIPRLGHHKIFYLMPRFLHLVLLSKYVTLWTDEIKFNGERRPHKKLSEDQREMMRDAVKAASEALFALSLESRAPDSSEGRRIAWTITPGTERGGPTGTFSDVEALTPDPDMIQIIARAIDPINCVVIPFFALFLASQWGRGMSCNLDCLEPEVLDGWKEPRHIRPHGKVRRLLDLTADTLEQAAPNQTHPAVGHARMIRSLIAKASRAPKTGYEGADDKIDDMPTAMRNVNNNPPLATAMPEPFLSAPVVAAPGSEPSPDENFDYASLFGMDLSLDGTDIDWQSLGLNSTSSFPLLG